MSPAVRAFVEAFREANGETTVGEIREIAERHGIDQDKLIEALLSGDSFRSAEILGVDAYELDQALHLTGPVPLGEPDEWKETLHPTSYPYALARIELERALSKNICESLCLDAYTALLEAERLCLNASPLMPGNSIVAALVRAFEHQLDHVLIEPLRRSLNGVPDLSSVARKLVEGNRLTLGDKAQLIYFPRPELERICRETNIELAGLSKFLPTVIDVRNRVSHQTHFTMAEAQEIKDRWLGLIGSQGVFAALAPSRA